MCSLLINTKKHNTLSLMALQDRSNRSNPATADKSTSVFVQWADKILFTDHKWTHSIVSNSYHIYWQIVLNRTYKLWNHAVTILHLYMYDEDNSIPLLLTSTKPRHALFTQFPRKSCPCLLGPLRAPFVTIIDTLVMNLCCYNNV